ncbi:SH3 domain-containing protein [Pseudobutyrivibrio sp. YE44]|uniref:C40 family peptidase n=1 Tax=Pseudobutyrivibrio sp. YE44 TaxID=1520802 RepID=UPI00088291DA|nr:SH3 domain-containing C40 family peptidase [Pseudobutyrivibrio sp. YE44]SDB08625.1 SH3 domain-containing protein [Pseudobutyrivibrio sp. YE44]
MNKRVVSAFSVACATLLLLDYCADNRYTKVDTSVKTESASATAGAVSVAAVDLSSLEEPSVTDSNAIATAKSLGDIYGYKNLGICNVDSGNLNIREEASKDSKLVGKLPANAGCEIIETEGEWSKIKSGEVEGYVLSEYLFTGTEAWDKAVELAEFVATAKTGGLRVRGEGNTDSEIIYQLAEGEEIAILDNTQDEEWIKVDVDGDEGYVCAEYVDVDLSLKTAMTLTEARYGAGVSDVRMAVCENALQYVGNRYVWGGTSLTNGVDCSGFTMQIMRQYGVYLSHSSKAQANEGTTISTSELKPGDLIFYGRGKSINHVAIYIGGGQICHASNKRDGIKISNYMYRTPIKCVRVLYD